MPLHRYHNSPILALALFASSQLASPVVAQTNPLNALWPQPATVPSGPRPPGPSYEATAELPAHDPLTIKAEAARWKGLFAYAPLVSWSPTDPDNKTRFFILRGQGISAQLNGAPTNAAVYPAVNGEGDCFDLQWAPNLQGLLFKSGAHDWLHASYSLFYWNFKQRTINPIGSNSFFTQVKWSPQSDYVAYAQGGDSLGTEEDGATTLYATNVNTRKTTRIIEHPALGYIEDASFRNLPIFSWSSAHTLLLATPNQAINSRPRIYPSIFEVDLRTARSKKIISAGYAPLPSPDNKWLAFLGWPQQSQTANKKKWPHTKSTTTRQFKLCLFNRQTSKTVVLDELPGQTSLKDFTYRWTPNSQSLLTISSRFQLDNPNEAPVNPQPRQGTETIQINSLHIAQLWNKNTRLKKAATISLRSYPETILASHDVLEASRDGKALFLKIYQPQTLPYRIVQENLVSVDLATGTTTTLAEFRPQDQNTKGWDWRELG